MVKHRCKLCGNDGWAIILSGIDNKVDVIELTNRPSYEWSDYVTLKYNNDIAWFDSEESALGFVIENFTTEMISSSLFRDRKPNKIAIPEGFGWDTQHIVR